MFIRILVLIKEHLECNHEPEAVKAFKLLIIIPLICHTNQGPMSLDDKGQKLSNRESLRRKINLINEDQWHTFSALSLGLVGNQPRPNKDKMKNKDVAPDLSALESKIIYLCSKGDFSKAYSTLFPNASAPFNDDTLNNLASLHPPAESDSQWKENVRNHISDSSITITENMVRDYIHKCDHLIGPGPSATTMDTFKALMGSPRSIEGSKFITSLTWLQNYMANEKIPSEIATMLQYSSLIALDKGMGKIRPIAMGETLRKMNAALILQIIDADVKDMFKGAQLGMESMGTEKIIHSINHAQQTHKEWDTLCLDHKNAFNLVKRSVIAAKLIADFPQVVNYFRTFYCDSASLLLSDPNTLDVFEFFSCTGIQQGDVNGPFLHNVGTINYVRN
jgi:hypothetical protein